MANINENIESSEAQCKMIRRHLESGKTITWVEAYNLFNCARLGARIWDLRNDKKDPMPIRATMVTDPKSRKRFAQYSL